MNSYASHTISSSSFIKRFSHKGRFKKALSLIKLREEDVMLDFGTGDGYLLNLINKQYPKNKITGYEPVNYMFEQIKIKNSNIKLTKNLKELEGNSFNFISCLEVFEHFEKQDQHKLLKEIKSKLTPDGRIVISVPIEVGLSSLFKNLVRVILKHLEKDTSFKNICKALFFIPVKRTKTDVYISSHIGFNFKNLEKVFKEENLIIEQKEYSPLNFFKSYINSQIFYVLKLKKA